MGIRYKDSNKSLLVYREYSIETNPIRIDNIESKLSKKWYVHSWLKYTIFTNIFKKKLS